MNRPFIVFLAMAITLFSCTKETGDGNGGNQVEMVLNSSEARPLQIITAEVTGIDLQNDGYSGTIGGVEVQLYHSGDLPSNSLVCLVPENVGTGIQTLSVELEGKTLTSNINVLANQTVTTPEDVFDAFYADFTTADYLEFIDESELQDALDVLRGLPESDRLVAAQMLANNRVVLDNIAQAIADAEAETGLGFGKTQSCDMLCIIGAATAVVGAFLSAPIASAVGLGVLAGYVARALKPVVTALWNKLVTGVGMALRLGYDRMAYITELVYDEAEQMIGNKVEAVPDTIFLENGTPLKLAIKTVREPLVQESNRETYPVVGGFLDAYYKLQNFLMNTEYVVPSLESGEVEAYALDLNKFSITVDNPLVVASEITGTPELAEVSFDSPQVGAHIFNFTYSYENDEGTVSSFTQTARLLNINRHINWSGMGTSFSDTDPRSMDVKTDVYQNQNMQSTRYVNLELGDFWHVNTPETFSGTVRVDRVYFRIDNYTGPGTYVPVTGNFPDVGIMDVDIWNNVPYDMASGEWLWDNTDYCTYGESAYGQGFTASVTITNDEWIGPYLVMDGTFNITITTSGLSNSVSCGLPATFTGGFRVAAITL